MFAELERVTGWQLTLVTPSNWITEYGHQCGGGRWPAFNGELIALPVWRPGDITLHAYKTSFSRLIRRVDPDVIYVHHEPYALATAQVYWANQRTLRRPIGFYSAQNLIKRYPPPFRWTESMVLRQSSFCFPISTAVDDVLRQKGYAGPSTTLPLGIDPQVYYPRPEALAIKDRLRAGRADEILIGYVGRLVQEKGVLTLLKAVAAMKELNWRLVVVGAGPLEARFDAEARKLGLSDKITRVGFVPHEEAPAYLSALDVLAVPSETQPSWKEQFGRVVIEAMACGTPVVGSDSGEIPKLIEDTGGGLVFAERQPLQLAEKLTMLIRDPDLNVQLKARGAESVRQRYTMPAIVEKFATAVVRAVAGSASGSLRGDRTLQASL